MNRAHGFSLIEMAVVLFIVVLLLGSLLVPFATQVEQRRIAETQDTMEEIKEALLGYALSHYATTPTASGTLQPYIPCPDANTGAIAPNVNNDGVEDRTAGACDAPLGNLPWVTLGTASADAWGNRFHYGVTPLFSDSTKGFGLTDSGQLTVCTSAKPLAASNCTTRVAANIPAVVLSYGKNGYGALGSSGPFNQPPTGQDEIENTPADPDWTFYVSRVLTPAGVPAGEFDDIVVWLSPNVLFNRMVAAQRLP